MKRYRPARDVYADVERALAAHKPCAKGRKLLERVAELLQEGRRYDWVRVSLKIGEQTFAKARCGTPTASAAEWEAPIQIVTRVLGSLKVGGPRLGNTDRVLLKNIARRLARFLTGKGKYIVRQAREQGAGNAGEMRGYQPSSERAAVVGGRRVAAGEKS